MTNLLKIRKENEYYLTLEATFRTTFGSFVEQSRNQSCKRPAQDGKSVDSETPDSCWSGISLL
jgi:hypothetical protein